MNLKDRVEKLESSDPGGRPGYAWQDYRQTEADAIRRFRDQHPNHCGPIIIIRWMDAGNNQPIPATVAQ
jgi:hypothetical protein